MTDGIADIYALEEKSGWDCRYEGCPRYYYKKQFQLPVWNLNGNCMKKAKPCMCSDYMPLTLEEWIEYDQRRRNKADRQGTLLRALDGFSPDFMSDGRHQ